MSNPVVEHFHALNLCDTNEGKLYNLLYEALPNDISSVGVREIAKYLSNNAVMVLPCNIGDKVYVIKYCRCGNPEPVTQGHSFKKETVATPKSLHTAMKQQMGKKTMSNGLGHIWREWKPVGTICYRIYEKPFELKMLGDFGTKVFLNLDDAVSMVKELTK